MRYHYNRVTEDTLIKRYIESAAVQDLFNARLEYDMAFDYLQIKGDFLEPVLDNYKRAGQYCEKDHIYSFKFKESREFFPIINEFLGEYTGDSFSYDLEKYLESQTTLSELCVSNVIEEWKKYVLN